MSRLRVVSGRDGLCQIVPSSWAFAISICRFVTVDNSLVTDSSLEESLEVVRQTTNLPESSKLTV